MRRAWEGPRLACRTTVINLYDTDIVDRSVRIKRLRALGLALVALAILLFAQTGMSLTVALLFAVGLSIVQVA